jgi:hypothetical protein
MTAGPVVFSWQDLFLFLLPQQLIAFALHASKNPILIPTISPTNSPEDPKSKNQRDMKNEETRMKNQ